VAVLTSSRLQPGVPDLCPQPFVGRAYLAWQIGRHLRGQAKAGADIQIGPLAQGDLIAHLALREGIQAHVVQRVAVG
jgi:hypothetical protein